MTEEDIRFQILPAPDEAPLTHCPHCDAVYNTVEDDCDDYTPMGDGVHQHVCGGLVRIITLEERNELGL